MEVLQRCFLRRQSCFFQQKYAFTSLKLHVASKLFPTVSFGEPSKIENELDPIEQDNKQLYLQYMEQVLLNKEQDLIQLESQLNLKDDKLNRMEAEKKIMNPLAMNHQAQILNKKIEVFKDILNRQGLSKELDEFNRSLLLVQEACTTNYLNIQEEIMRQYGQFTAQKQEMTEKLSKLSELESYQKYLSKLQKTLQEKEYDIIQREKDLQRAKVDSRTFTEHQSPSYITSHPSHQSVVGDLPQDTSVRKRTRIFNSKSDRQSNFMESHMQSSKIMDEEALQFSELHHNKYLSKSKQSPEKKAPVMVEDSMVQTEKIQIQNQDKTEAQKAISRLKQEKHFIKFLRLWFKFSDRCQKGSLNHHKTMNLYLWRLNTVYNQENYFKIKEHIEWPLKQVFFPHLPKFDYSSLSLKKKIYVQKFLDYQCRQIHKKKVLTLLRSITRNRNRKERLIVLLYFKKYWANIHGSRNAQSLMYISNSGALREKNQNDAAVKNNNDTKPVKEQKGKQTKSRADGRISQTNLNSSQVKVNRSRSRLKGDFSMNGVDISRLKEYIRGQEEVEYRLAMECAQTQAVFRFEKTLSCKVRQSQYTFMSLLGEVNTNHRIAHLQKSINSHQFKWELFMAKARLALTTTSNKVSHLEQLATFLTGEK